MSVKKQMMCCLIAFIMLLTGVCVEQKKANPLLEYPINEEQASRIISVEKVLTMDVCTTEMLVRQSLFCFRQVKSRHVQVRRDLRLLVRSISCIIVSDFFPKFFSIEDMVYSENVHSSSVVVNYIHSMDGKKRI